MALLSSHLSLENSAPEKCFAWQVVVWSALSYALHGAPAGVPRKVDLPDTWQDTGPWSVSRVSGAVVS